MRSPSLQALEGIEAVKGTAEAWEGTVFELPKDYSSLLEILHNKDARATRAFHVAVDDPSELAPFTSQDIPLIASGSAQEASDMAAVASLLARDTGRPVLHFFDRRWVGREFAKIDVLAREDWGASAEIRKPPQETAAEAFERLCARLKAITGRSYGAYEYTGPAEPSRIAATLGQDAGPDAETGVVRVRLWRPFDGRRFLDSFPSTVRSLAATKVLQADVLAAIHQGIVGGWSWFTTLPPITDLSPSSPSPEDVFEAILRDGGSGGEAQTAVRELLKNISSRSPSYFQCYTITEGGTTGIHLRLSRNPIRRHGPVLRPSLTISLAGPLLTASGPDLRERSLDLRDIARRAGLGDVVSPILTASLLSLLDSETWLGLPAEGAFETVSEAVQDRWGEFSGEIVDAHRRAMDLARREITLSSPRPAPVLPLHAGEGNFPARPSAGATDVRTAYMGFRLGSPFIACVSEEAPRQDLAAAPIGALFFGPISEEELDREAWKTFLALNRGEPEPGFEARPPLERHLELLRGWKSAVETPVIAGIEAVSEKNWLALAFAVEQAGADAIELFLKSSEEGGSADPLRIIQLVSAAVRIPVAARITPGLCPFLKEEFGSLSQAGLKALVLFRTPQGPVPHPDSLERRDEVLLPGHQIFRLALPVLGTLPREGIDLGAAGPVSASGDVLGALLSGVSAVYVTPEADNLRRLQEVLKAWMESKGFGSVKEAGDFFARDRRRPSGEESRNVQRSGS
ncbi:MAG TPA: hypothetical protein VLJ37_05365 [bacterium]|nr:hypothetical protein [bacterium]